MCVLSLERNIGREDEFRVSGGSEFQRRGPRTEKVLLPSDDRTYGMERTSESEDRVNRSYIESHVWDFELQKSVNILKQSLKCNIPFHYESIIEQTFTFK